MASVPGRSCNVAPSKQTLRISRAAFPSPARSPAKLGLGRRSASRGPDYFWVDARLTESADMDVLFASAQPPLRVSARVSIPCLHPAPQLKACIIPCKPGLYRMRALGATDTARQAHTGPPARQPPPIPQQLSRRATGTHWNSQALPAPRFRPAPHGHGACMRAQTSQPKLSCAASGAASGVRRRVSAGGALSLPWPAGEGRLVEDLRGLAWAEWWLCQSSPPVRLR
jgi:hypothetical protein